MFWVWIFCVDVWMYHLYTGLEDRRHPHQVVGYSFKIIVKFGSLMSMYGCYHHRIGAEDRRHPRQATGFWGYAFQIMFQTVAGAVVLTDCIFWFIIVPFLAIQDDFSLNYLTIALHSTNVVFLLGDTTLNSLRFPWFRIAYFVL